MNKNGKKMAKMMVIPSFAAGLILIFFCCADGIWNGRLMLGLVMLVASYALEQYSNK